MAGDAVRARAAGLLAPAGVEIDGGRPWDIRVRDGWLFGRVLAEGALGLGGYRAPR